MSERAALVAAILADPDSDAPRLRFADWFEQETDPPSIARAHFIRTQVERARLAPTDPRQSELQARELRLLKKYGPAWCGEHFAFRKVRFRRGFIEYVHLHLNHFLHHRRQLFALEPLRDVRLTGWHRAHDPLVRHVAACQEWRHIETLRIHHQGPHMSPRSNLILLLESPCLTGLRHLHLPLLEFDADARRRLERLPILRQLETLRIPYLERYPLEPGDWFSDGGADAANQWSNLRSVALPFYLNIDLLRQFTAMSWWDQLSSLELTFQWDFADCLEILRRRLPPSLRGLTLGLGTSAAETGDTAALFARFAQLPLDRLELNNLPLSPDDLRRLFKDDARCRLRHLSLSCDLTADHVRAIAESPAASRLLTLTIAAWCFPDAARPLFASPHLRSLVNLDLHVMRLEPQQIAALAQAEGWTNLRSLKLSQGVTTKGFEALLASPNVRNLTRLVVSERSRDAQALVIRRDAANQLSALPHLTWLNLSANGCEPHAREILENNHAIAWKELDFSADDDFDIAAHRARQAPERTPPVDEAFDGERRGE